MQTFNQLLSRSCLLYLLAVFELTNTVQTEQPEMNLDYVEDIADNLNCFHNQQDDVDKLPCRPGYRRARDREDSSCTLCPFSEDLQTFQPEENDCDKCILCSKCGEGEEVSSHCTRRRNTVCKTIGNNTVRTSTTTKDDEIQTITTLPSTKLQPMKTINGSSRLVTNHPETMAKTHEDPWMLPFFIMMGYAIFITCLVFFLLLLLYWLMKKWMKKSVNSHPSSSGSRGHLDNGILEERETPV